MPESPNGAGKSEQQQRHWHDHAAVWAAIAAALAAVAAAGAGTYQGYVGNRALDIARKANENAIRPYIKVKLEPESFIIHIPAANDVPVVEFKIENIGKLPALVWVQSAANWNDRGHPADDKQWPATDVSARMFLFPGSESPDIKGKFVDFTPGQLADISGSGHYYAMVDVLYGPSKNIETSGPSRDYETKVCTVFNIKRDNLSGGVVAITLGDGEPCPSDGSNYAK
jgi:hypothetical protein